MRTITIRKNSLRSVDYVTAFVAIVFGIIVFLIAVPVILNWPLAVKFFSALGIM